MAPVPMTALGRRRPLAAAPLPRPAVDDHVPALAGEYVLEVAVSSGGLTRHDEEQTCHDRLPQVRDSDRSTRGWEPPDDARTRPVATIRAAGSTGSRVCQKTARPERRKARAAARLSRWSYDEDDRRPRATTRT